jgi:hypothetical protein
VGQVNDNLIFGRGKKTTANLFKEGAGSQNEDVKE